MTTMRDKYGDLLLLTPDGWKFVDENDYESPRQPMWWGYDELDKEDEEDDD